MLRMLKDIQELSGPGVYLLYRRGRLVYVGKTKDAGKRLAKLVPGAVDAGYLLRLANPLTRSAVERSLIAILLPPGNVADRSPIVHAHQARRAPKRADSRRKADLGAVP